MYFIDFSKSSIFRWFSKSGRGPQAEIELGWTPPTDPFSRQGSSRSEHGVDIDDDGNDDDDDDGFIWNLLDRPGAQMLCFTTNSRWHSKPFKKHPF